MIFDPTHTIPEYNMILLDMKYPIGYIIPFRLVDVEFAFKNIYLEINIS